jgi:hypothetical protein
VYQANFVILLKNNQKRESMKRIGLFIQLTIICLLPVTTIFAQTNLDSVLDQRNKLYEEFRLMRGTKGQKTWLKMSDESVAANKIIEIDQSLIDLYLKKEIDHNRVLENEIEKLTLEIDFIKKETEHQNKIIEDNKHMINLLMIVIGSLILLLVIAIVLFIDRQIRFRSIKLELERTWPLREELNKDSSLQNDLMQLNKQIGELSMKNNNLQDQLKDLKQYSIEKDEALQKETLLRKQIEEEIKKLIIQLKAQ